MSQILTAVHPLHNGHTMVSFIQTSSLSSLVMGQGPSPARARPGALGFWRALGPTLGEGLKPGPGPSPWSKARGLKGLLEYDFPLKNWHYFGKF